MKIIIAPAKKMLSSIDYMEAETTPLFIQESEQLKRYMQTLDVPSLKKILGCSEAIAVQAYQMYQTMNLHDALVPALLAFDGIQYTYMAPHIFETKWYDYARQHLYILSGFYGVLRAFDGVVPYRLEINNPFHTDFCSSLYDFWKDKIYQAIIKEDQDILDLASAQHSHIVQKFVTPNVRYVKCYFMEDDGIQLREKGVYVKMARGAMVRYLSENNILDFEGVKTFHELGYRFDEAKSDTSHYIFVRKQKLKR
ncbi:peroxide stress protein YaaA [Beduini massiliensis]|uniref:peroxide stress protein YaaA n=1 Tax=Beduini massiliensis TaxID=1585974 RepID=UPI00059A84F9|nr:peroxide stress protein YaaA [Beduini massiliensis]